MKQVRAVISGRVQGVWFRGWTCEQAQARGLQGWVRNLKNGQVEAVFKGEEALVDDMLKVCWDGPMAANVSAVNVQSDTSPVTGGFEQAPTY